MKVSTAPTGWVKTNTFNLNVMRVVTGTASSGGSKAYTDVFVQNTTTVSSSGGSSGATTLTAPQTAAHTHVFYTLNFNNYALVSPPISTGFVVNTTSTPASATAPTGTSTSHSHTITLGSTSLSPTNSFDLRVKYVDCIIVQRS